MDVNILNSLKSDCNLEACVDVIDRYYEHKYCTSFTTPDMNLDQCVSFHSNRICVISLADNHDVLRLKKKIKSIACSIDATTNRLHNVATGRMKRGAQKLEPTSILCNIECEDGTFYPVYSCIKAKLIEINENLLENSQLIADKPLGEGYIAILFPSLALYDEFKKNMLSREEYLNCEINKLKLNNE